MAGDLPPGKWTAALIGPWWPSPSTALRGAAQHWNQSCTQQQQHSQDLRNQWTQIAAHNQGHTADDLISRYQDGEKFHLDLTEKYRTKAAAFDSGADAVDFLRSRLADIANSGNPALAGVATVNAAVMLEQTVSAAPVLRLLIGPPHVQSTAAYTKGHPLGSWLQHGRSRLAVSGRRCQSRGSRDEKGTAVADDQPLLQ